MEAIPISETLFFLVFRIHDNALQAETQQPPLGKRRLERLL
jgi:hypothetical protein